MRAAADIYGGGVEVDVQIEEGSLITRITVVGGLLLGAYSTIADYKGFKDRVVEMCDDAREFAVDVCSPFVKKAGVPNEDVYRFERRLKTPGKLYRLSTTLADFAEGGRQAASHIACIVVVKAARRGRGWLV